MKQSRTIEQNLEASLKSGNTICGSLCAIPQIFPSFHLPGAWLNGISSPSLKLDKAMSSALGNEM